MAKKHEVAKRERRIMDLVEQGLPNTDIFAMVAHEFRVSEKTVRNQYYRLVGSVGAVNSATKDEWRGVILSRHESLYRRAVQAGNIKNANDVLNSQAKLLGLNEKVAEAPERAETIIFKPKDMSKPLEVVPDSDKAENE